MPSQSSLTDEEKVLLTEVVRGRPPRLRDLRGQLLAGHKLTAADANALRDAIANELAETGIDVETGALDERGKRLDGLIDRVAAFSELYDQ